MPQNNMHGGDWYPPNYMPQGYPQSTSPYQQMPDYQMNFQYPRQQQNNARNKSLFNPQTRSFVPNTEGRRSRQKNNSRHSINSKEDTLKSRYGTPASLPKKPPPPSEKKHPAEVIDTAVLAEAS